MQQNDACDFTFELIILSIWNSNMAKRGGKRPNAGRKTAQQEFNLIRRLDAVIDNEKWEALIERMYAFAMSGSAPHAKLLIEYRYGRAREMKIDDATKPQISTVDLKQLSRDALKEIEDAKIVP